MLLAAGAQRRDLPAAASSARNQAWAPAGRSPPRARSTAEPGQGQHAPRLLPSTPAAPAQQVRDRQSRLLPPSARRSPQRASSCRVATGEPPTTSSLGRRPRRRRHQHRPPAYPHRRSQFALYRLALGISVTSPCCLPSRERTSVSAVSRLEAATSRIPWWRSGRTPDRRQPQEPASWNPDRTGLRR